MTYSYNYDFSPGYAYAGMGIGIGGMIIGLLIAAVAIVAMWRIFEKAGEPGWAALVPLYNVYVLYKITWGNGWNFLLMLIPIANVVIAIMTMIKLAKVFGKSGGFAAGLIFLGPIFIMILAFGSARYVGINATAGPQPSYTPPQPGPAPQSAAADDRWQCACGAWSTGKFCINCGAAKPEPPKPRFCPSCGNQLSGNEKFCGRCGAPVE